MPSFVLFWNGVLLRCLERFWTCGLKLPCPVPPMCWDYRRMPLCPASIILMDSLDSHKVKTCDFVWFWSWLCPSTGQIRGTQDLLFPRSSPQTVTGVWSKLGQCSAPSPSCGITWDGCSTVTQSSLDWLGCWLCNEWSAPLPHVTSRCFLGPTPNCWYWVHFSGSASGTGDQNSI